MATVAGGLLAAWLLAAASPAHAQDAQAHHLIYLHGRIVQDQQDPRPRHPSWGHYELEQILATLRERGFAVSGDIRPRAASLSESADRVVEQVQDLLKSGVPARRVIVVGASMGASITFLASIRLQQPELRFAVLGACLSANVEYLRNEEGSAPVGRLLAVRDTSDQTTGGCAPWTEAASDELRAREVVIETGLDHGFLYRPLPEWIDPVVAWAEAAEP